MTAQVHENLIYEGEFTTMASSPEIPEDHPLIVPDEDFFKEDDSEISLVAGAGPGVGLTTIFGKPASKKYPGILYSTACWRKYLGTWEIKQGRLYLNDIVGRFKKLSDEPIFAEWFTGEIVIPRGPMVQYIHMGFGSKYQKELHLKIENGVVVEEILVENKPPKKRKRSQK
ncbi:MAG: hypothetical protein J7L94_07915 [Caldisericaceae bacterium]|nr:hypothetical protein [Caldisericaceae bacterium]